MTDLYAIYGAGGFGREVMPLLRDHLLREGRLAAVEIPQRLCFVDDSPPAALVNGHRVLSWEAFLAEPARERHAVLALGSSSARRTLAAKCAAAGVRFLQVRAPTVTILDDVSVGEGALLCGFVTLTSNIRIGRQFQMNIYSYVGHDCVVGDFVTFAPKVCCNGNVVIEDDAYLGTGAIIRQGKPGEPIVIGRGAVVGMGAVVTRSVPPGVTVIGNPARPMEK